MDYLTHFHSKNANVLYIKEVVKTSVDIFHQFKVDTSLKQQFSMWLSHLYTTVLFHMFGNPTKPDRTHQVYANNKLYKHLEGVRTTRQD